MQNLRLCLDGDLPTMNQTIGPLFWINCHNISSWNPVSTKHPNNNLLIIGRYYRWLPTNYIYCIVESLTAEAVYDTKIWHCMIQHIIIKVTNNTLWFLQRKHHHTFAAKATNICNFISCFTFFHSFNLLMQVWKSDDDVKPNFSFSTWYVDLASISIFNNSKRRRRRWRRRNLVVICIFFLRAYYTSI